MGAKRLVKLRHRGTREQRANRVYRWRRRGHAKWQWYVLKHHWPHALHKFVHVTVTLENAGDSPLLDALVDTIAGRALDIARVPYTDDGIKVVKSAMYAALADAGYIEAKVE